MSTPPLVFKDLRQDRAGRLLYVPLSLRHGVFAVKPENAEALDRSASRILSMGMTGGALLSGLAIQRLPVALTILGSCLAIVFGLRVRLANGLEQVHVTPDELIRPVTSWTAYAERMGKVRLLVTLVVCGASAPLGLVGMARAPFPSGLFSGGLVWTVIFGGTAYVAGRGLRSLPRRGTGH